MRDFLPASNMSTLVVERSIPHNYWARNLDPKFVDGIYSIDRDAEATTFFKATTGIDDDAVLKKHIIGVQSRAFKDYNYPCIRTLEFAKLKIARLPDYKQFLELPRKRSRAIFVELGSCFGNDTRKAVFDGYPREDIICTDINEDFWKYGHELFRSTPESFPVPFLRGDVFDDNFLNEKEPVALENKPVEEVPQNLSSLNSLNPLRGHVSAVLAGSFFHLFEEDQQAEIARKIGGLLSPEPGSMVIGSHGCRHEKGHFVPTGQTSYKMFCHSVESWTELWQSIFGRERVEVRIHVRPEDGGLDFYGTFPGNETQHHVMEWSIIRK